MIRVNVRKGKEADISEIQDLAHDFFKGEVVRDAILNIDWPYLPEGKEHLLSMVSGTTCLCLVAETDSNIIGYLTGKVIEPTSKHPEKRTVIENIFIEGKFRNQHVGTLLMRALLKWSKEQNAKSILVDAYPTSEESIAFYKTFGFLPYWITLKAKIE